MRCNLALPLLVCLSACAAQTPEQQAKVRQILSVACSVDGAVVPVAQPVVATLGNDGAKVARADLLVHPAVVEACKALNGSPAGVTPAGAAVADTGAESPPAAN